MPNLVVMNINLNCATQLKKLHVGVVWAACTLWHHPSNILTWVLNVAGFAVNTVLAVDLEGLVTTFVLQYFVYPSRAISLCWFIKFF